MNKLLLRYIKQYLLSETTIPFSGSEITSHLQHKLSPKLKKDMTHIEDPKEILKVLMKNISDRTCISFVNPYIDGQGNKEVPYLNINPHAAFETPHGNYSYPLSRENLRELIRSGKIKGSSFAIDRPYFLIYKVNSPNTLVFNKDGSSNYKEILSNRAYNKKTSNYDNLSVESDINRVVRSFSHFVATGYYTKKSRKKFNSETFEEAFERFQSFLNKEIQKLLSINNDSQNILVQFFINISNAPEVKNFNKFVLRSDIPKNKLNKIIKFLKNLIRNNIHDLASSSKNRFFAKSLASKDFEFDDFHKVYFTCWFLSKTAQNLLNRNNNGPIFTAFLKEVGIDGIIDHASSTLHGSEPEQAVLLNFGNKEGKNVDFLGTFNNIFTQHVRKDLIDLAAEIYEEEGYKFETDFFSPDEHQYSEYALDMHSEFEFDWVKNNEYTKTIDNTFKLLDKMDIITYHDDLSQADQHTASFDIDIHTDMSDSQLDNLIEIIETKINYSIMNLEEEVGGVVKINHPFIQKTKSASQNVGEFLKKFYYNKYSSKYKYNSPFNSVLQNSLVNDPIYLSDHNTGILVYDEDFVEKTRVEEIILNNCGEDFTIVVNDIAYLSSLFTQNVLTVKSNSSVILDISNIYKQDKHNDAGIQVQEIIDKIKSESPNIKIKTS